MSADLLREAAALMRERAEAAIREDDWRRGIAKLGRRTPKGIHMDGMNPAVALAVAAILERRAAIIERDSMRFLVDGLDDDYYALARAYLGRDA